MKSINDIVNETMQQMEAYGLSAGTIRMQYYGIFKPLINLHATAGQPVYSPEIISQFFSSYEGRLTAGTVTQSHFATVKRAIQFLNSCAGTGTVDFSYAIRPIKVVPSDCHLQMVGECIQGIKGLSGREGRNIGLYMRHFFCFMERRIPDSSPVTDALVREFIFEACAKYEGSIGYIMRAVRCITAYLRFNEFIQEQHNKELYEVSMDDYTAENILAFMEWLENSRRNGISTVNQRLFEIRAFCKYLMRNDPLRIEALSAILDIEKRPVPAKGDFIYLDHRRLELLFAQPDIRTKTGIRDRFFLELMYDSGCRDQEMLDLKAKDFIIDRGKVSIKVVGKGNKFRMTPISEKILPSFFRYRDRFLPDNDPESLLFYTERKGIRTPMSDDNVARFMNKYEKMVRESDPEYPHLHPHLLRRSRAMNLYIHGMPLPLISEWLGHTQLETTTIYAQATTEMKRLAANKSDAANSSIFNEDVFKYANDEESLKRLYGLK